LENREREIVISDLPMEAKPELVRAGIRTLAVEGEIPSDVRVLSGKAGTEDAGSIIVQVGSHDAEDVMRRLLYHGSAPSPGRGDAGGKRAQVVRSTSLNMVQHVRMYGLSD